MGFITGLLKQPIADLISSVGMTVKMFVTTDKDRLDAAEKLAELQAQIEAKLIEADQAFADAQAKVIIAEATGESWLQRNWRPITMLCFVSVIMYNFMIGPMFHGAKVDVPSDLWDVIRIGLGGYVIGRSVEKVANSDAATAMTQALAAKITK